MKVRKMKQDIIVHRAGPSDTSLIKSLFRKIEVENEPENVNAHDLAESGFDKALSNFDFLTSDSFWLLIAKVDDEAVGYATLVRMPKADPRVNVVYLDELHILKSHRRLGAASALIHEAEAIAKEIGSWRLRLLVDPQNKPALKLYESLEFMMTELTFCQRSI